MWLVLAVGGGCDLWAPDVLPADLDGTGCLYGARDIMGLDGTVLLADDEEGGDFAAGDGAHMPAIRDWFQLDASPSVCGEEDQLTAARVVAWDAGEVPHDQILDACLADAEVDGQWGTLVLGDDSRKGLVGYWMALGGYASLPVSESRAGPRVGDESYEVNVTGAVADCTLVLEGSGFTAHAADDAIYVRQMDPVSLVAVTLESAGRRFDVGRHH